MATPPTPTNPFLHHPGLSPAPAPEAGAALEEAAVPTRTEATERCEPPEPLSP